jgi:hypothetical protein
MGLDGRREELVDDFVDQLNDAQSSLGEAVTPVRIIVSDVR